MKEGVVLAGFSFLFVLGAIGALVGFALTEPILTLDGLTVVAVCLLIAGVFSLVGLSFLKEAKSASKDANKPASPPAKPGGEKTA